MLISRLKSLESERLLMRPVRLSDTPFFYESAHASHEALQQWQSWARDLSLESLHEHVRKGVFDWQHARGPSFPMVLILKESGQMIGGGGYNCHTDVLAGVYELNYWCDSRFGGHGYITEAAALLARYALEVLNAKEVAISIKKANVKSQAVAQRLNFRFQKEVQGEYFDWLPADCDLNNRYVLHEASELPPISFQARYHEHRALEKDVVDWALDYFISRGKAIDFKTCQVIVNPPWSFVALLVAGGQKYYLKNPGKGLGQEADILRYAREKMMAPVPAFLASKPGSQAFITEDAGQPLRQLLRQHEGIELLEQAVESFTQLQQKSSEHLGAWYALGVPDWGLQNLPQLFAQFLYRQKAWLIDDGLSEEQWQQCLEKLPEIDNLYQELESYGLPTTLVQPDFNDNNIMAHPKTHQISFLDLGEVALSCPLFSMVNFIKQLQRHHHYLISEEQLNSLQEKSLHLWGGLTKDIWDLVEYLSLPYSVLAHERLMLSCGKEALSLLQKGRLADTIKRIVYKK